MDLGTGSLLDVHPLVGGVEDLFDGHPALGPSDAETRTDSDRPAVHPDGRNDRVPQPYGQVGGVGRAEPVGEDDELVTPEAGDGVAVAHAAREPARDLDENGVPGVVPEPVVDRLEAVEVAEEDGEALGAVVDVTPGGGDDVHVVVVGAAAGRREVEAVGPEAVLGSAAGVRAGLLVRLRLVRLRLVLLRLVRLLLVLPDLVRLVLVRLRVVPLRLPVVRRLLVVAPALPAGVAGLPAYSLKISSRMRFAPANSSASSGSS